MPTGYFPDGYFSEYWSEYWALGPGSASPDAIGWFPDKYWATGYWSNYWPLYGTGGGPGPSRRWKKMPFDPFRQFNVW
jgi:hypothetical protein